MTHAQLSGNATLVDRIQGQKMLSDFECLYNTLVKDGAVPSGFLSDFLKLEDHVRRAAQRAQTQYLSKSEDTAARELQDFQKQQQILGEKMWNSSWQTSW